jgi:Thioredoxin
MLPVIFILMVILLALVYVNSSEPELILFANDGCHNCQSFYPTWQMIEATTSIKKRVVKGEACSKYGVEYVPEIRLYKGDNYVRYPGNRDYYDIVSFIEANRY